jgi:MoaA/NifB/PqqE/SkfB family radical SAM enzyme
MDKKTFCYAPFNRTVVKTDGSLEVCCVSRTNTNLRFDQFDEWWNGDVVKKLRQDLVNGVRNSACQECWHHEDIGVKSYRQKYLVSNRNSKEILSSIRDNNFDQVDTTPITVELTLGNKCNLKCIMCTSKSSDKIQEEMEQHRDLFVEYNFKDFSLGKDFSYGETEEFVNFNKKILPGVTQLQLLGGEPLINNKFVDLLDLVENKKETAITFTTNGTLINERIIRVLKQFKSIGITVSIDNVNKPYEYIRTNSNFETVSKNVEILKTISTQPIEINAVINAVSVLNIIDLINYCEQNQFKFTPIFMDRPWHLHVDIMPDDLKLKCLSKLRSYQSQSYQIDLDRICKFVENSTFDPVRFVRFKNYVNLLDRIRQTNFLDVFPEYIPYWHL